MSKPNSTALNNGAPSSDNNSRRGKTAALAALRQAAWEATQFLSTSEVVDYVDRVMAEVERDEP